MPCGSSEFSLFLTPMATCASSTVQVQTSPWLEELCKIHIVNLGDKVASCDARGWRETSPKFEFSTINSQDAPYLKQTLAWGEVRILSGAISVRERYEQCRINKCGFYIVEFNSQAREWAALCVRTKEAALLEATRQNRQKSTKIGRNQRELECVCAFLIDLAWAQANLRGQSRAKERFWCVRKLSESKVLD